MEAYILPFFPPCPRYALHLRADIFDDFFFLQTYLLLFFFFFLVCRIPDDVLPFPFFPRLSRQTTLSSLAFDFFFLFS